MVGGVVGVWRGVWWGCGGGVYVTDGVLERNL